MGADLAFALIIALAVSALFWALSGRPSVGSEAMGIFLLALLLIWAAGAWLTPFGPLLWGGYWLPFLIPGLLLLLLLAALVPTRPRGRRQDMVEPARGDADAAETAFLVVGTFFWVLIVVLVVAIVAAYL